MKRREFLATAPPAAGLLGAITARASAGGRQARAIFNNDATTFYEAPVDNVKAFTEAWLDRELDRVPITSYVLDVALPDMCFHDTKVGERIGDRYGERLDETTIMPSRLNHIKMIRVFRALNKSGTDMLALVSQILRKRGGIEVLAGVRMADTHHTLDPKDPLCPQFALDHPEYVIRQPDGRAYEAALDYSFPEVRAHRLAILRELVEKYDIDGLELNFVRFGKHFPRDQGYEKAPILTNFLGEVHRVLDEVAARRRRSRFTLGVRVPNGIRECWLAGIDAEGWAKKGWLDFLVAGTAGESDLQIRVEDFSRFTRGRCELQIAMGNLAGGVWTGLPKIRDRGVAQYLESYGGMLMTDEEARGFANNYHAWGADGISFWNITCNMGFEGKFIGPAQQERTRAWMRSVLDRKGVSEGSRRYHFLPLWKRKKLPERGRYAWWAREQSPIGTTNTQILRFADDEVGVRKSYEFRMADGRDGKPLDGTLQFRVFHVSDDDRIEVDINNRPIPYSRVRRRLGSREEDGLPGIWFTIELSDCPPFQGDNSLGLILHTSRVREAVPYMEELDIRVRAANNG